MAKVGVNAFLVRWDGGWLERANGNTPRSEAKLSVGALHSITEADAVADAHLAWFTSENRTQVDLATDSTLADTASLPYTAYLCGDSVGVEALDGSTVAHRTAIITVTEVDDTGEANVTPTFVPPSSSPGPVFFIDPEIALLNAVKKMANGTLRGQSRAAQPYVPESLGPAVPTG